MEAGRAGMRTLLGSRHLALVGLGFGLGLGLGPAGRCPLCAPCGFWWPTPRLCRLWNSSVARSIGRIGRVGRIGRIGRVGRVGRIDGVASSRLQSIRTYHATDVKG